MNCKYHNIHQIASIRQDAARDVKAHNHYYLKELNTQFQIAVTALERISELKEIYSLEFDRLSGIR